MLRRRISPRARPGGARMSDEEALAQIEEFALGYVPADRDEFRFQWNGKESEEFEDENDEIRGLIADWILLNPDRAPLELIRDVLREDALWAQQAWQVPAHVAPLLEVLKRRGGAAYVQEFAAVLDSR